ncbi:MAG: response regulator [Ignavibacteriae bacterium]|nr:MAG: response regulator [Ignavibacteriota bacterium]
MESTRIPEITKSSREILKHVDQLVKSNNLEKALQEVKKAREVDPKNLYAFAYEERIHELFAQQQRNKLGIPAKGGETGAAGRGLTPYNLNEHILNDQTGNNGLKVPALYEEFKKAGLRSSENIVQDDVRQASNEALDTYKQALLLVWSDGQKTEEEVAELQDLRQTLNISTEEHEVLDKQAKLECYIFLLKHLLQHASETEVKETLSELRKSFDVSQNDQDAINSNLAEGKEPKKKKWKIAVVDDDEQILSLMKATLLQAKYAVAEFGTSDEAYEYLQKEHTDLILCDISLETSTMNGFLFYEKIRDLRHLQQVPFIFITGLDDAVLMRAGKEIGVDDFLVKPIHRENLLATIRGRLKKYEQFMLFSTLQ